MGWEIRQVMSWPKAFLHLSAAWTILAKLQTALINAKHIFCSCVRKLPRGAIYHSYPLWTNQAPVTRIDNWSAEANSSQLLLKERVNHLSSNLFFMAVYDSPANDSRNMWGPRKYQDWEYWERCYGGECESLEHVVVYSTVCFMKSWSLKLVLIISFSTEFR